MFLVMGIDVDHDITNVGKGIEDQLLDPGGNIMGLLDRHGRVHLKLEVDNHVLAGAAPTDVMDMLHPLDTFCQAGNLFDKVRRCASVHQVMGSIPEGLVADMQDEE